MGGLPPDASLVTLVLLMTSPLMCCNLVMVLAVVEIRVEALVEAAPPRWIPIPAMNQIDPDILVSLLLTDDRELFFSTISTV